MSLNPQQNQGVEANLAAEQQHARTTQLFQQLRHPDPEVRQLVLLSLEKGALGTVAPVVAAICDTLIRDGAATVRAQAARLLARAGDCAERAVPSLVAALRDGASEVACAALQSLGALGAEARLAIPAVVAIRTARSEEHELVDLALSCERRIRSSAQGVEASGECIKPFQRRRWVSAVSDARASLRWERVRPYLQEVCASMYSAEGGLDKTADVAAGEQRRMAIASAAFAAATGEERRSTALAYAYCLGDDRSHYHADALKGFVALMNDEYLVASGALRIAEDRALGNVPRLSAIEVLIEQVQASPSVRFRHLIVDELCALLVPSAERRPTLGETRPESFKEYMRSLFGEKSAEASDVKTGPGMARSEEDDEQVRAATLRAIGVIGATLPEGLSENAYRVCRALTRDTDKFIAAAAHRALGQSVDRHMHDLPAVLDALSGESRGDVLAAGLAALQARSASFDPDQSRTVMQFLRRTVDKRFRFVAEAQKAWRGSQLRMNESLVTLLAGQSRLSWLVQDTAEARELSWRLAEHPDQKLALSVRRELYSMLACTGKKDLLIEDATVALRSPTDPFRAVQSSAIASAAEGQALFAWIGAKTDFLSVAVLAIEQLLKPSDKQRVLIERLATGGSAAHGVVSSILLQLCNSGRSSFLELVATPAIERSPEQRALTELMLKAVKDSPEIHEAASAHYRLLRHVSELSRAEDRGIADQATALLRVIGVAESRIEKARAMSFPTTLVVESLLIPLTVGEEEIIGGARHGSPEALQTMLCAAQALIDHYVEADRWQVLAHIAASTDCIPVKALSMRALENRP